MGLLGYRLLLTMSRRLPVPALLGFICPFSWLFTHFLFFLPLLFLPSCPFRSSLTPPRFIVTDFLSFSCPSGLILLFLIHCVSSFFFTLFCHQFLGRIVFYHQSLQSYKSTSQVSKSLKPFDLGQNEFNQSDSRESPRLWRRSSTSPTATPASPAPAHNLLVPPLPAQIIVDSGRIHLKFCKRSKQTSIIYRAGCTPASYPTI